jgi:RNA polymerase sigma factor (TIGR02999 family)
MAALRSGRHNLGRGAPSLKAALMSDVTRILSAIEQGDPSAAEQLLPLVYDELRKLAAQKMRQEKPGQTLQATALVHEAYIRLVDVEKAQHWDSRGHFFGAAAEAMRRILVENARRKKRKEHGGQLQRVALEELLVGVDSPPDELLRLDETLGELGKSDSQTAELVKLHCFAGLSIEQAADLLGISHRTAYRDWAYARAWLFKSIERGNRNTAD